MGSYLLKFFDNTALFSLLQRPESDNGSAPPAFGDWCVENFLDLNLSKTKELTTDLEKNSNYNPKISSIHRKDVEITENIYKYLGAVFDFQFKFNVLSELGQQRIHLLWKLNSFNAFIESLLISFICWFNGLCVKDMNSLLCIVKVCSKVFRVQ